jgi:hypothetical protein
VTGKAISRSSNKTYGHMSEQNVSSLTEETVYA